MNIQASEFKMLVSTWAPILLAHLWSLLVMAGLHRNTLGQFLNPMANIPKSVPAYNMEAEEAPKQVSKEKKKKKQTTDILGFPNQLSPPLNLFVAFSVSISSSGIENRNRILLQEAAQTVWAVNKLMGLSCDGNEDEEL